MVLSYPLLTHLAVHFHSIVLTSYAAGVLLLLVLARSLRAGRIWAWLLLVAGIAALAGLALHARARYTLLALYLPPVLMYLLTAWLFARTLGPGDRPLITRLVWHLHGQPAELAPALVNYTRRLTRLWAITLTLIASLNTALALLASPDGVLELLGVHNPLPIAQGIWSLVANFLSFGLVVALFTLEYGYRRRRFPDDHARYRNLFDFLAQMRRVMPAMSRDLLR